MTVQSPTRAIQERIFAWKSRPRTRPPDILGPRGSAIRPDRLGWLSAAAASAAPAAGSGLEGKAERDPLLALVDRITQGFSLAEYDRARALGYEGYLEEQLDHLSIDDSALDARLAGFTSLAMSPKEIVDNFPTDITAPYYEIKGATLLRSVFSRRQLFERMCEFWSDHLNLDHNKGDFMYVFKPEDDRTVIRQNALGKFPELLSASAHSAAMLFYLDNWLNVAGAIQENYARELMELHTLGVDGGYTEQDVKEVAKCLTGWTLNGDYSSPNYLRALFVNDYHKGGDKLVLGNTVPANPPRHNLTRVLEILSAHPSTARFIARKMIRWLLAENPPPSLVEQVAGTYLDTQGDIKAMIRVILARENLARSSPAYAPKLRRPFHLMTSILRGLGAEVTDYFYPLYYLYAMGHSPFDWSPPNGYPDTVNAWGNSILPRWTFLSHLMEGHVSGVQLSAAKLLAKLDMTDPANHAGLARRINRRILGGALAAKDEERLQQFIDARASPFTWPEVYEAIALAASMPGYQWY